MAKSDLDSKIKNLVEEPGVYQMKDAAGSILYVGKAKNLKARVSSYFKESKDHSPRIKLLISKIADFEIVITDNEVEALILEFNLIKKHKPKFNVLMRDDKSYPYVRLDMEHAFPKLEYVRRLRKDGAKYYGPYVSSFQIKDVLGWARKAFKLRDCSDNEFRNRSRACILHQMGQCSAPCVGKISQEEYAHSISQALKMLDGKTDEVIDDLTRQMKMHSEHEEFEQAAALRDRIQNIEQINQEQKVLDPNSEKNRDVVHFARQDAFAVVVVMSIREGRTVGVLQYPFTDVDPQMQTSEFLLEFLSQYYLERFEQAPQLLPNEILLPEEASGEMDQLKLLSRAIGKSREFRIPKRGEAADLIAMVRKTADYHLTELANKRTSTVEELIDVQKKLDLKKFPHRIECFDISHFQGEGTVASRVVFIDGVPEKKFYRHYHVEGVEGVDDFASMREIIRRRFEGDQVMPDLVLLDGGKGQLAQGELVFEELGVVGVELASIAKARTQSDFTSEEVKVSSERIFKPNQKNPILLKPGTGSHRILTHARDEAHRFAITFHRKVRDSSRF